MSTRKELARLISTLCSTFNVDISDDLVTSYADSLADIDFAFVKAACDQLVKESDWMPKPAEIRRISKRDQAEANPIPAEPEHWRRDTYRCQTCRDTGYVTVWHPRAMAAALAYLAKQATEEVFRRNQYQAAAKCTCQRGQNRPGSAATYNPDSHVKIDHGSHSDRVEALLDRVKTLKPPNYVPEFDDGRGE